MDDLEIDPRISKGAIAQHRRLTVVFTRDQGLIAKYRQLRKQLYGKDRRFVGFRFFSDHEAEHYEDADDQMVIIHDGAHVYGGACLRISTPQKPLILDMEKDILPGPGKWYFSLRESLPEMDLDKYAYAEFNRLVIHPSFRTGALTKRVFEAIRDRCLDGHVRYIFGFSDAMRARYYKRLFTQAGLEGDVLRQPAIPPRPEYEKTKMVLFYGDTKPFYITGNADDTALLDPITDLAFTGSPAA